MRRILILALAAALVTAIAPAGHSEKETLKLIRVNVESRAQASDLMTNYDETHNHSQDQIEILAWPGDIARLEASGYTYEVVEDDVIGRDQRLFKETPDVLVALPGPDRKDYRVLADYNNEMKQLAKKNPNLVKLFEAPHPTLEGRTVYGLEMTKNVKRDDGRPTFYVDGVHHAREWPAGEYPMIFAHYLVEKFGKNKAVSQVLRRGRVVIIPIVNPDGFDYSRSSPFALQPNVDSTHGVACNIAGCEAYWRKNRRSLTGATIPVAQKNPDAYGVDVNRNYAWKWGGAGASDDKTSLTHYGDGPVSEPETKNVQKVVLSHNVTSIVSNHTFSRLVLRPWGDTYIPAPDEKYLARLGGKMAKAMGGYANIKGMQLYPTTGTMSDWGYGILGVPSYTFEHGTAFHPPYSGCQRDCVGKSWPGVMKAFMHGAKAALDSDAHGVLKGNVAGQGPAKLTLVKKVSTPLSAGNPTGKKSYTETIKVDMTTSKKGRFVWHLAPSTRPHLKKGVEKYTLHVAGKGGKRTLKLALRGGQTLNLGNIRL
jgi:hypothetical protein